MDYNEIDEIVRKNVANAKTYNYGTILEMLAYSSLQSKTSVVALLASINDKKLSTEDWENLLQVAAKLINTNVCTLLGFISRINDTISDSDWNEDAEMLAAEQAAAAEYDEARQAEAEMMLNGNYEEDDFPYSDADIEFETMCCQNNGIPYEEDDPAWAQ